jgi:sugar O-acyltransferase (sialic acid O-acetyltransferase NeuD family)
MNKPLILLGDSAFAEVAYEYFTYDSPHEVAVFAVEKSFRRRETLCGLPVVDIETLASKYPPAGFVFHAAITYNALNRTRSRLIQTMCAQGFEPVSYIHSSVKLWPSVTLGSHCFIFENNVIQPQARLGCNCVLWSGNHIGHHAEIGDNCFISSQVVLSGFSKVGANTFIGVNSTVAHEVEIGPDCFIGAGSIITRNLPANMLTKPAACQSVSGAKLLLGVKDEMA